MMLYLPTRFLTNTIKYDINIGSGRQVLPLPYILIFISKVCKEAYTVFFMEIYDIWSLLLKGNMQLF